MDRTARDARYRELLSELFADIIKDTHQKLLEWYTVTCGGTYFAFRGQIPYILHRGLGNKYFYVGGVEVAVNMNDIDELERAIESQLRELRRQRMEDGPSEYSRRRTMLAAAVRQMRRRG